MSSSAPDPLFQAAPAGLAELDPDGTIRRANRALATLAGAPSPEALRGTGLKALLPADQGERIDTALDTARAGESARLRVDSEGSRLPNLDLAFSAVPADSGAITGFVLVAQSAHGPAEAEEHYEEMFRRNPAPKLLIDPENGYIADANPAALAFYGYSLTTIRAKRIQDINLLSEAEVRAEWERARREERRYFEFRHRLADGEIRDVKVYSGPMRVAGREYLHSIIHDITEPRRYQEHLEQYKSLFDRLPVGIYRNYAGDEGRFAEVNPAMARIFGAESPQNLIGYPVAQLYRDPSQRRRFSEDLEANGAVYDRELALQTLDGRPIWGAITAQAHQTATGDTVFDGVIEDITERKQAEHARDRLVEILEATPDFVSIARPDGTVLYLNEGGRRLLGLPPSSTGLGEQLPESVRGETAGEWAHPEWASRLIKEEGVPTAIAEGYWEGETALLDVHGRGIPVSEVILAHRNEAGELTRLSAIMRDISRHKDLENRLHQRQEALRRLQNITGDPACPLETKLRGILELGAEFFELPYGIVSQVEGREYRIRQAASPDGSLAPGKRFDLGNTYCAQVLGAEGPAGFPDTTDADHRDHPCYPTGGMQAYLGVPVRVGSEIYGTLNFSRPEPRSPYSDFEWELLKLMGQWISFELTREANHRALERERSLFVGGPTVVFVWGVGTGWPVHYASPNVQTNFGYAPEDLLERPFADLIHPEDQERVEAQFGHRLPAAASSTELEYRIRAGDGGYRWVRDFTVPARDEQGRIESLQGYLLDITARRELEADQRLLATTFHTSQAILITDPEGTIERVNPAFTAITGYAPEEAIGRSPRLLASGCQDEAFYHDLWQTLAAQDHWEGEIWNRRKSGEIFPQWESISAVRNEAGEVEHYVAVFHEIGEQKRLEAELERLATHDRLTGVYNRAKLYEFLEQARSEHARYGTPLAIIMFDIDHFKAVNDRLGHGVGDSVLRDLSRRVAGLLRETDRFGRWGGEEFLIVAPQTGGDSAEQLAERVRSAVAAAAFEGADRITVSLGVAEMAPGETIEQLEERADNALYAAKAAGRNRVARG